MGVTTRRAGTGGALARTCGILALAGALSSCASSGPHAPPAPRAALPAPDSAAVAIARRWTPVLDAPRVDGAGRVAWSRAPLPVRPGVAAVRERLQARDTVSAWRLALATPSLEPFALRQWARTGLASGDTSRADSAWSRLASLDSPWGWEGLRERADLAAAAGRDGRADSLLEAADRDGWTDPDRAAWLARRARLGVLLGDTTAAIERYRQLIRRYPATPAAGSGVTLLESLLEARGERPTLDDAIAAAEAFALRGDRRTAATRLEAALLRAPAERRFRIGLRTGELQRQDRSYVACRKTLGAALRDASGDEDRARVLLELARVDRDAGDETAGLAGYQRALARTSVPAQRAVVAWEYALELDGAGRGAQARAAYRTVMRVGGARAAEASLRAALSWLAEGRRDSARALLAAATDDAGRFWRAALRPGTERAIADTELRAVAARPGYGFYAVAARETLAVRGWNGTLARDGCAHREACAPLDRALDLASVGATDDAMTVLGRWASAAGADSRLAIGETSAVASETADPESATEGLVDPASPVDSAAARILDPTEAAGLRPALLRASRIAYNAGRLPAGIRMAQRALDASDPSAVWAVTPWLFPPAFDSLYTALPESTWHSGLTPELARAVAWQESRFDPQARSRSNALGLYQLKLPTAGDVARWLHEPPPTEARLFDPARSIRYGVAYLTWLLSRFEGHAIVAVAAYNSGPGAVSPDWHRDLDRGGVALFCERIGRTETRDYVRRIMAARAAYRELKPYAE